MQDDNKCFEIKQGKERKLRIKVIKEIEDKCHRKGDI